MGDAPPCRVKKHSPWLPNFSAMRLGLTQHKQLPSGALNRRSNVEARRAVAIGGQSHGRMLVARRVPKIPSAGGPRRIATSIFAAFRRQKHEQKSATR